MAHTEIRAKILRVSADAWLHVLASLDGERRFRVEGLPPDARLAREFPPDVGHDEREIWLVVESDSFDLVVVDLGKFAFGLPMFDVQISRVDPPSASWRDRPPML